MSVASDFFKNFKGSLMQPGNRRWYVLAAVIAIDIIWIFAGGYRVSLHSLTNLSLGALCIVMLIGFVRYGRGRDDLAGVVNWASGTLFLVPFSIAAVVLSYLASSVDMPLVDPQLVAIDHAVGFDWMGLMNFVNAHAIFGKLVSAIYFTAFPQLALIVLFLGLTRRADAMHELIDIYWVSLIATIALSAIFPAVDPYSFYAPDLSHFPVVKPYAGIVFLPDYLALRAGTFHTFDFGSMQGIIEFPSFHAALALMMTWAVRQIPWMLILDCIYNSLMIIATLTEGGHYLSDVIIGCLIVCITIAIRHHLTQPKAIPTTTGPLQASRGFD